MCAVIFRSQIKIAANKINGANRKTKEINNWALPKVIVPIKAITAIQVGVALELPNPTWCQDSPYKRHNSETPLGDSGSAPPAIAPNLP